MSFLSRQTPVSCDKHVFIATNRFLLRQTCVCHDATCLLSRQKYACGDKIMFFATKLLSQQIFVATNTCLFVCRDTGFVLTSILLSRQKMCFAATKVCMSRQYLCRKRNMFVATNIYRDTSFVTTSMLLSRQKTYFVATNMCLS